jgi:prephenate dehydrogenase
MAGSERSGPGAATDSLFVSARVLVSQFDETPPAVVADAESFWLALGGQPTPLPLRDHDSVLAAISHFPHLVSYGLAAMLSRSPMARMAQNLHGGGLRDTTRIAASSPELWAEIMLDNRDAMLQLLGHWRLAFDGLVQALEKGDRTALIQGLSEAADWRRQF